MPPGIKVNQETLKFKASRRRFLLKSVPAINQAELQKFCRAKLDWFRKFGDYNMTPNGPYIFQDNGSDVLMVIPIDTVQKAHHFSSLKLTHDKYIFCPTLKNRLGAYTALSYLPQIDIIPDVLLVTGGTKIQSSAFYFSPSKKYNWMFSFDFEGTNVACGEYWNFEVDTPLRRAGWKLGHTVYSDIDDLAHLHIVGFNFGNGIHHETKIDAYVSEVEFLLSIKKFTSFFKQNVDIKYKYTPKYNHYTSDEGFGYMYKPGSEPYQDTFTESDIELLEQLEYEGIEFDKRITPMDLKEEIKRQTQISKEFEANVEPTLFEKAEKKKKVVQMLPSSHYKRFEEEAQLERRNAPYAVITHCDGDDLAAVEVIMDKEKKQGKQFIGPIINTDQTESPKSQSKRVVSFIPMEKVKDDEETYVYKQNDQGGWSWIKRLAVSSEGKLVY